MSRDILDMYSRSYIPLQLIAKELGRKANGFPLRTHYIRIFKNKIQTNRQTDRCNSSSTFFFFKPNR